MDPAAAQHLGARLLGEIEEESLEELITTLKTSLSPNPALHPPIPIPLLASLASRHHLATKSAPPPLLSLTGRYLPFLYHLISTLVASPHNYTIVIVDADHRFDVTRLVSSPSSIPSVSSKAHPATPADLKHIHIYRPARSASGTQSQIQACLDAAKDFMTYGEHASRARTWWGTVVVGGRGGDVSAGWKGWLDVQRTEVAGFGTGVSVEEALAERERREEARRNRGWEARSRFGVYAWGGGATTLKQ